jgi:hypothetical protein
MLFSLVNMSLIPLALLVLVPLLVHLFARARPPRYSFSSLEFLRRVMRQTMRVRRPRDWIVWLLRTLLAATLIALFLRPISRSGSGATPFERRNVVVVIDRSASMAALAGGRSRFATACAEASELLVGLSRRDTANVIWMDSSPDSVFPEMGPNVPYLLGNVRSASVSFESADIEQALDMAVAMLRSVEGGREIDIVSDFQSSAWQDVKLPDLEGASLVAVPAASGSPANTALTDLSLTPAEPLPGERVQVSCSVWNYGASPIRPSLYLSAGEMSQSRDLFIPPWSRTVAQFDIAFPEAGEVAVSAECTEDDFAADNARFAAVRVRPHLRAAFVGATTATSKVWERALLALGLFRIEHHATLASLDDDWDAILVSNWDGASSERLVQAARDGAVVLVSAGASIESAALHSLGFFSEGVASMGESGVLTRRTFSKPRRLVLASPDAPLFTLFSAGAYGDPARGLFSSVLPVPPLAADRGLTLLAYSDGVPALAQIGSAPLYLWNLDLDPATTDWPQYAAFLPLFGELFLGERGRTSGRADAVPGIPIPLGLPPGTRVELMTAAGGKDAVRLLGDSTAASPSIFPSAPCVAAWRSLETDHSGMHGVNLAAVESDLRPMTSSAVHESISATVVSGRRARDLREGVEWWPWLVAAVLAWALVEALALWKWEGRR